MALITPIIVWPLGSLFRKNKKTDDQIDKKQKRTDTLGDEEYYHAV